MNSTLSWKVKVYDCNRKQIIDYDVLRYRILEIKKLKKKCRDIEEFSNEMKREMMYHYWSKCEWELIVYIEENEKVYLSPWIGDETLVADVTLDKIFDWMGFAKKHIGKQIFKDKAKIDVYDQLEYKWQEFIGHCWYTRLPYERKDRKFERK